MPPVAWAPIPVRRRRRWPWTLLFTAVAFVACCCGVPAYLGKPVLDQYPAKASLPAKVGDLTLRNDGSSRSTARDLERDMRTAHLMAEDTFAGVYGDRDGKRVTVFGATGFRWDTQSAMEDEFSRLTAKYRLSNVRDVTDGTERDEYRRCGIGRQGDATVVACTWADHGSVGTALFTRRALDESADLLGTLREAILRRP